MTDWDRSVHARLADGSEVVRYDRAGKYFLESPDGSRERITLGKAVQHAFTARDNDGRVFLDQPGGQSFDALFRRLDRVRGHLSPPAGR